MSRKTLFRIAVVLLTSLLAVSGQMFSVLGWSNSGQSSNPSNPNYGTHDWIAQHALDWLPPTEKQYILDNLAQYLYGTELPDYGIGDKGKHHVYYFANGSLQEDDSAARAQEEYLNAVNFVLADDLANASKALGMMSHYISDLAVFGHVMGEVLSSMAAGNLDLMLLRLLGQRLFQRRLLEPLSRFCLRWRRE